MKKLMALLLAATTAISMFAGSVSAINFDDEVAYTGAYLPARVVVGATDITVYQDYYTGDIYHKTKVTDSTGTLIDNDLKLQNFVDHIELGEPVDTPMDYTAYVAANQDTRELKYGKIYMYDYVEENLNEKEKEQQEDLEEFAELIDDISRLSGTGWQTQTKYLAKFIDAWKAAYKASFSYDENIATRYDAVTQARANQRAIRDFVNGGALKDGIYDEEFDGNGNLIDGDRYWYNVDGLYADVYAAYTNRASLTTSQLVYINNEYERVATEVSYADQTTVMDRYYVLLDKLTAYVEEDFTASGWRTFQENLEEAEEIAADAKTTPEWNEAIEALEAAEKVKGKAVDYTDLQDALIELFVGDGKVADIVRSNVYSGADDGKHAYIKADYKVRSGYSQEWYDFAGEDANGNIDGERSAFTKAYDAWKAVRSIATAEKQSYIDTVTEDLLAAVDALVSNADDVEEWLIVKLQSAVDAAEALVETDFNTASRKWEDFQEDIADAKEVLEKSKPSKAEVNRAFDNLAAEYTGSYYKMRESAKSVSTAKKDELKDLVRTADRLLSNISTQTGAQVAALREAVEDADEVQTNLKNPAYTWKKATISEVDGAIADLTAAIDNFNNPQGWYKEDGKWYYGVGAEVYADGWAQIGETWYMFNADGSLKMSEWFQVEGKWYWANENGGLAVGFAKVDGKWYFFDQGNAMKTGWVKVDNNWYYFAASGAMVTGWNWIGGSCYYFYNNGAMAANTTVGGYKVDANGAWVK